ncbi:MAG: helix-turn-helix domain-containing protein [Bacteroidales bacterium]
MDNLQSLIDILPVYQSLIFSGLAFIMYLRGEGYHRLALGLFMLGNALLFTIQGLWDLGEGWSMLLAFILGLPIWLLQLPLFYFFLKSVLQPGYVLSSKDFKHLLPSLAGVFLMLFFHLQPATAKEAYLQGLEPSTQGLKIFRYLYLGSVYGGIYLQFLIYLWYAFRRYPKYLKNILNYYSNPEHYSLSWLRWMLFLFILSYLLFDIIRLLKIQVDTYLFNEFTLVMIFLNLGLGFFGLTQPNTWFEHRRLSENPAEQEISESNRNDSEKEETHEIHPKSSAFQKDANEELPPWMEDIILRAEKLLLEQKPWRNPEFTITDLSIMLGINSKYVSRAINQHTGMTFSQWINLFRIREAEQLLLSEKTRHFSMEGIFTKCGFSNKNTFLNAFKKVHGVTPSIYREKKLQERQEQ